MKLFTLISALVLIVTSLIAYRRERSWKWALLLALGVFLIFLWFMLK